MDLVSDGTRAAVVRDLAFAIDPLCSDLSTDPRVLWIAERSDLFGDDRERFFAERIFVGACGGTVAIHAVHWKTVRSRRWFLDRRASRFRRFDTCGGEIFEAALSRVRRL